MVWLLRGPRLSVLAKNVSHLNHNAPAPGTVVRAADASRAPAGTNYALAANGATATGGSRPEELIDGNDAHYSGGTGFATSTWNTTPVPSFLITLKEAVPIDCIRILLWDRDETRFYRYKLEVCADEKGTAWTMAADRTGPAEQCRSWQTARIKPQPVKLIKLTGTYNSSNSGFHVVEVQASVGLPKGATDSIAPEGMDF
jgi:hypothetical protein